MDVSDDSPTDNVKLTELESTATQKMFEEKTELRLSGLEEQLVHIAEMITTLTKGKANAHRDNYSSPNLPCPIPKDVIEEVHQQRQQSSVPQRLPNPSIQVDVAPEVMPLADASTPEQGYAVIHHAPCWAVYTTNFALFTFIIKHDSRWHSKTRWQMAHPRTQNRNAAHGDDTQRAWHPQTQLSKTTANRQRRIASQGLSGSAVYATGMGNIEIHIAGGHTLKLVDALYIPDANVRLISILVLNKSGNYTTHFDSDGCWVTNKSNTVLVRGALSTSKHLYVLTTKIPSMQTQEKPDNLTTLTAFYIRVLDIETWHRCLGHCNVHLIVDMAKTGVTQGMPIDLSILPTNCDHCTLRKQLHSSVLKVREGLKASKRLERVYADLCGPMAVTSRTGNVYAMNIIDDYSGYVWSVPLRSKTDACSAFQTWHKSVTVQMGDTLRILITNNGKLVSKSMQNYCDTHGINHQLTTPYTSAQNGRAERLHRTIASKARMTRLACNAPEYLWDEFFATAAYLTTLTATSANNGHTPYEQWFNQKPSLSHLREIRCRAFSLHTPIPSKLYSRSTPCILIGYAPHAKAYHLWDPSTSRIFNSYHVTFTEHLNAEASPLLPGTTLGIEHTSLPPSWESSGIIPAPDHPDSINHPQPSIPNPDTFPSSHNAPILSASIPISSLSPSQITTSSITHLNTSNNNVTNNTI